MELGLQQIEQRGASLVPPLSTATMSVNNFAMAALGSLPTLAPPVGFSNPGGTRNLGATGATTAGVSIDEFEQVLV